MVPNRQTESSDPVLEGKKCHSMDTGQCASWLYSRGGLCTPLICGYRHSNPISLLSPGKLRWLSAEMSLQEAQDHLCQCSMLTSCYIWVEQPSPRLLPPSRNSMELRSIHLPQPLHKPVVIPQEQAKGQTGGRDLLKSSLILRDFKGFYSHFCCTKCSPWPLNYCRLQRHSLARQDKTHPGHGNCMKSLTLFSHLLHSKAHDFWVLEVNKRSSQGFTNSVFWTAELRIYVFDLASTACLVFFSINFSFWKITRKIKKEECVTTHQCL